MVMKAPPKEKEVEFNVLVAEVDKSRLDGAAESFSAAFGLEASVAQQIVKSAPIVFLLGASKAEIKAITPRLIEVSKAGIEFRVTTRSVQRIPKVNWPVRPQFAFGTGPEDAGRSARFNFERNIFVCPCCGETFLFRRVGRPPLGEGESQAPAAQAPAPPRAAPKAMPSLDETAVPPPQEEPAQEPEIQAEPADNLLAEEPPAPEEDALLPQEEELAPPEVPAPEPAPEPALDEEPEPPPPPKPVAAAKPAPRPAPVAAPKQAPPPPPEPEAEAPAESPEAASGEAGGYNVFLSKITSNDKKEQAAKLISEIKSCPIEEARELAGRLIIPLLKEVSKAEAEAALNKFKGIKITGRMTASRGRK